MLLLATEDADRGWEDGGGKWITVFGYGAFVGGGIWADLYRFWNKGRDGV